jgi:hypothetical protein
MFYRNLEKIIFKNNLWYTVYESPGVYRNKTVYTNEPFMVFIEDYFYRLDYLLVDGEAEKEINKIKRYV